MERLTYRLNDQFDNPTDSIILMPYLRYEDSETRKKILNRLAAYEDSGLEPQDIISAVDMAKIACALHELNAYKDLGPIDHIRDLIKAEQDGRLVVLPCKVGEYWRDWDGERVRIESVSFSFIRRHLCNTDMVTYRYDDEEDDFAVNWIYFKSHFTREEAEAALAQKGVTNEDSGVL